jgi:hypothetical protein
VQLVTNGWLALALVAALGACDEGPPIKTASGERIGGVSYEERFPLSNDVHSVSFHGDRLRRAVELMDKDGVTGLTGEVASTGVLDKSSLTIVVTGTDGRERKLVVKNCAEPHVCAFFAEAVKSGIAEKLPVVCREPVACNTK